MSAFTARAQPVMSLLSEANIPTGAVAGYSANDVCWNCRIAKPACLYDPLDESVR